MPLSLSKNKPQPIKLPIDPRYGRDPLSVRRGIEDHVVCDLAVDQYNATLNDVYLGLANAVRDRVMWQWMKTKQTQHITKSKRVFYLSMEYLIGQSLANNVINLGIEKEVREALDERGLKLEDLIEHECDAGLGNGGLGRLAACFMDSLATMDLPAIGYGLRFEYGIFRQEIRKGYQVEEPDSWLRSGYPWDIPRLEYRVPVEFGGRVELRQEDGHLYFDWVDTHTILGIPYDYPVIGYGGKTINTLRLWQATSPRYFDFQDFNQGDYFAAVESEMRAENITKVLYPNDAFYQGRELRLRQEYFFAACSLSDILQRFRRMSDDWNDLPKLSAIQMNDTHPSLAVAELMRQLVDMAGLPWEQAWDLTVRTLGYTNHTLLPEALEKWPVELFERLLPRHLQLIYEINARFLRQVSQRYPGDNGKLARMSLVEEGPVRQVRMANLAIVGSHSVNGVAKLHSELLKTQVVGDFAQMMPERFNNKTNGVTPRRWLLKANPALAALITEHVGPQWVTDLSQLQRLKPLAEDAKFQQKFLAVKRQAKEALVEWLHGNFGFQADPTALFDVQIKRIHEYKRQLLNVLHIVMLYNRLRKNSAADGPPRVFLLAGKAAPGYQTAKRIIKLINNVAEVINHDPAVAGRLKVIFVPNYNVSAAERIIPAADLSEQISTAGTEASGTSNMKFMMNGALTIGTLDGANIEIVDEVGRDNAFIFGLTAQQVSGSRGWYSPWWHYNQEPETRDALNLIFSDHFSQNEKGVFSCFHRVLLDDGDRYMHLADLQSYAQAQNAAHALYARPNEWARKAILNVAASGQFSSDRTIQDYARDIWDVKPCPVPTT